MVAVTTEDQQRGGKYDKLYGAERSKVVQE